MAKWTQWTAKKEADFLAILSNGSSVQAAVQAIGCSRSNAYKRRQNDPEFAAQWDAAIEAGSDLLEDEAKRRAHEGVLEPVYYQGQEVGQVRKYSDTLLMFMLKARRPDKFKERKEQQLTGKDGERLKPTINLTIGSEPSSA